MKPQPMSPHSAFAPFTDPRAVHELLRTHVQELVGSERELAGCEVLHAWRKTYEKPDSWDRSYLNVCYELRFANALGAREASALVHGRAYFHHRGEPEADPKHAPLATLQVAGVDLALRRFPDDALLPQLALLADTARLLEFVPTEVLPELAELRDVRLHVVNYRPGERCTLRYDITLEQPARTLSLYAKTYRDDTGAGVHRHLLELCASEARALKVSVAQPLGYDEATHTVWQRGAQGISAAQCLAGSAAPAAVEAMARSFAALHGAGLSYERVALREQALFEARKRANKLGFAYPELDVSLRQLAEDLARERYALPAGKPAVLHGDAHVSQFLIAGDEAIMFDFDEITYGDAEQDLANFIISLQLDHDADARLIDNFLGEYQLQAAYAINYVLLGWHYRLLLLNKAYRVFWRQGPQANELVERALSLAAQDSPVWH